MGKTTKELLDDIKCTIKECCDNFGSYFVEKDFNVITGCEQFFKSVKAQFSVVIAGAKDTLNVRVVETCTPQLTNSIQYECNITTGFLDRIIYVFENGVLVDTIVDPTTTPCDQSPPSTGFQIESVPQCIDGTIQIVTTKFEGDPVQETILKIQDTGETCAPEALVLTKDCNLNDAYRVTDECSLAKLAEILTELQAVVTSTPHGAEIAASATFTFPVSAVRTFTVTNESADPVTVNLSGGSVILQPNTQRTWGNGDAAALIDVSTVSIVAGASDNADVIWEV